MKAVYYYDDKLQGSPVKIYLSRYKGDDRVLVDIDRKIKFVIDHDGRPVPPTSKALHGYGYLEIRTRKDADRLIRIFYFRHEDKIVLLNSIEKSDHDSKKKDKQDMEKCLDTTKKYKINFINNPQSYEDYK